MYEVSCCFCAAKIVTEFWDVIQEHILACYDTLSLKERGTPWYADVPDGPGYSKDEVENFVWKMECAA